MLNFDPNKFDQNAQSMGISSIEDQQAEEEKKRQQEQKPQQSWLRRNAGTIGAIGAGLATAPFTGGLSLIPALAIAGVAGAGGAALGEYTGQKLNKEQSNTKEIGKQALVGGIGNATGELIGPAFKGIMSAFGKGGANAIADTAGNIADKTASKGLADELATKTATSAFTVPRAIAERINPQEVMSNMLDYGINPKTMNGLKGVVNNVTGSGGIINKMVTEAAAKTKTPISLDTVFQGMKNLGDTLPELTVSEQVPIKKMISSIITPANGSAGILKTNALDALDAIRKLESQGYKFYNAANRAGGTEQLVNSAKAKLFLGAADDLKMATEQVIGKSGIDMVKTPEALMQLSKISPKLSQKVMNTNNLSDLRSVQSPFVRLGQMVKETENAANTAFTKGGSSVGKMGGAVGGFALGHIPGAIAGYVGEPLLEGVGQAVNAPIKLGAAQAIKGAGKIINKAAPIISDSTNLGMGQYAANKVLNPSLPQNPADIYNPTSQQLETDMNQPSTQNNQEPNIMGLTAKDLNHLMLQDMISNGGKSNAKIAALQSALAATTKNSGLTTAQQTQSDNLTNALSSLDSARQNLVTSGGAKGPLMGMAAKTPLVGQYIDPKGTAYNATKIELATSLAKAITGGSRPAESVIQAYLHSLPDITDTPEYAQAKLDKLYSELLVKAKSYGLNDIVNQYK